MQEPSFTVTATIQSPDNEPVEMRWCTNNTPIGAMVAIAQLLDQAVDNDQTVPAVVRTKVLKIEVTVNHDQAPWL